VQLQAEARASISGLMLSNENYTIAVEILKERYDNKQDIIDLHHSKLMNLTPLNNEQNV